MSNPGLLLEAKEKDRKQQQAAAFANLEETLGPL